MQIDEAVYLHHILDAIFYIESYAKNLNHEEFMKNHLVQDGVIRQLEIVGEAVKSISDKTRIRYNNIPWKDLAGMRDVLIHQYFGVDLKEVWITIQNDIPMLKENIQKIISE
jgi:uncharacterized protein with HEPN domain